MKKYLQIFILLVVLIGILCLGVYWVVQLRLSRGPKYTITPVSSLQQSVKPDNYLGLSFHFAYALDDDIFFSEVSIQDLVVVQELQRKDSAALVVEKKDTRMELPLEGMIGFKAVDGQPFKPLLVRDLSSKLTVGSKVSVSLFYTSPLVKASYQEIQEKLMASIDMSTGQTEKARALHNRGRRRVSENDISAMFLQSNSVRIPPEVMVVSTVEVLP